MTIDELKKTVGRRYIRTVQGKAYGCASPLYKLYPDLPRFEWPKEAKYANPVMDMLRKNCIHVDKEERKAGDILLFFMPFGTAHLGIYLGNDQVIHCPAHQTMEICRLNLLERRLNGVYRWGGD